MALTIRDEQFETLLQRDEPAFVDRILAEVRDMQPANRLPDDILRHDIRTGIGRARAHGLTSDRHVMEYVLVMFETAPNFDQQPEIARLLADTSLTPQQRWERLFTPEMDRAWNKTDDPGFYDARFWWPDDYDWETSAPDLTDLTDRDWAELAHVLSYLRDHPNAESVPQASAAQLDRLVAAFQAAQQKRR